MANERPIEEALRRTEERFRLLVESVRDYAIFLLDPNGVVVSWNIGAERIKGYKADEIIGQSFAKFYPPEDVASGKLERELDIARREGRYEEDGWRVRKDGSRFLAHVVITALRAPSGEVIGFAKVTQDLTERVRAEQQRVSLAQSEHTAGLLGRVLELSGALGGAQTPQDVAEAAVVSGIDALGARAAAFFRVDRGDLELVAAKDLEPDVAQAWRRLPATGDTPMAAALRTREAQFSDALVTLPLLASNDVLAVVAYAFDPRRFHDDERALLRTLAAQIAQALDRSMAYAREREAHDRLAVLMELSNGLSRTITIDDVARVVIERGMLMSRADTCTLYAYDEPSGVLDLIGERGCSPEVVERIRRIDAHSLNPIYATVQTRRPLYAETPEEYAKLVPQVAQMPGSGPRAQAFWSAPLVAEGRTIGLLGMGFYAPRRIPLELRNLVEAFSRQCAEAILRATRLQTEKFSRARLATTLRSIGDAVIATDVKGAITMMNPVAEKATQWSEVEAQGRPLAEVFRIVNEHTRAIVQSPVEKVLELGTVVGLANHTMLVRRDGTEIPIEDSGAPIRSEGAPVEGVVLVFRDASAQKEDEARRTFLADATGALAESLDYEATLAKAARLAVPRLADWCAVDIVVADAPRPKRLAVAHVDPAKVKYAHELEQKYPADTNAPTGLPHVLRTGQSELYADIPDELLVASTKDAEHLRVARELGLRSAMIVPLVAHGRTLGAITFVMAESGRRYDEGDLAFARDLAGRFAIAIENAELYRAEQRARQGADVANRAKDEFLAVVSHELRTPLNAILGWAKLMSAREFDEARRARAVETIERNAVAMAQLIEDLLDMSRIVSGKMRLEVHPVSLDAVVAAALDSIKPAADAKGISVTTRLRETIPNVMGDAARLQQIVWNLLSNAVKFTAKGGHVEVTAHAERDAVSVSVKDDGVGIAPHFLPYVFDPFSQEDARITRARGGLGLGLAITKQLVELHGGRIDVTSEGEGRGTTFTVTLPLRARHDDLPAREDRVAPVREPALRGLRVLVVDDERDARELVQTILADAGCEVTMASSVDEALAIVDARPLDVVLADVSMPQRDGYELIRELRARPKNRGGDLPAAALTAYARAEDKRRLLEAGYTMHLPKPIDPTELTTVVSSLTQFARR